METSPPRAVCRRVRRAVSCCALLVTAGSSPSTVMVAAFRPPVQSHRPAAARAAGPALRRGMDARASSFGSYHDDWKQRRIEELLESPRDLDADTLTELFAPQGYLRHEQRVMPDKGYGAVFRLESVLLDTRAFEQALWTTAGAEMHMPPPDPQRVDDIGELSREGRLSVYFGASPVDSARLAERYKALLLRLGSGVISTGYREYFKEPEREQRENSGGFLGFDEIAPPTAAAESLASEAGGALLGSAEVDPQFAGVLNSDHAAVDALKASTPLPGFCSFADSVRSYEVPCAVVTSYPRGVARKLLDAAGLWDKYFDGPGAMALVAEDDGFLTPAQAYLAAALHLERAPSIVAVFDSHPLRMVAAHDVEMRAVAVLGASSSPRYDFRAADLVVDRLDELNIVNLRKLFSDRVFAWDEQLQLQLSAAGQARRTPRRQLMLASAEFEPDTEEDVADQATKPLPQYQL